jgi:hypothetical protein
MHRSGFRKARSGSQSAFAIDLDSNCFRDRLNFAIQGVSLPRDMLGGCTQTRPTACLHDGALEGSQRRGEGIGDQLSWSIGDDSYDPKTRATGRVKEPEKPIWVKKQRGR